MDKQKIKVFQFQVLLQCQFIVQAAKLSENNEYLWFSLQMILVSAGNISKALWGQSGRYERERQPLRDTIKVNDSSPLKILNMRNDWEHFDERIDEWWLKSESRMFYDRNVGFNFSDRSPIDIFRNWDPEKQELVFWGKKLNIKEIVCEIERIMPLLENECFGDSM